MLWERFCICSLWNNNFIHVVESPYGSVVKRKCISLNQLRYFNVFCVLDNKPMLYKGRWHYYCMILLKYFCERSELLICQVHQFLQGAFFSRLHKKLSPLGFRIRGNFFERNLIGQWQQCKWGNSTHWSEEDLIDQLQQCVMGKLIGQW